MLQWKHRQRFKYYFIDYQMNAQFSVPPFLNRRYEISKLLGRGTYFLKKWEMRKQKWYTMQEGRKKIRNLWGDGILYYFYIITFSYLGIMVTHHALRKSSLKNIFSKIVTPGTSNHIIQTCQFFVLTLDFYLFVSP